MKWSECGHLLATASGPRLTIWDAANLEVLQVFSIKVQHPDLGCKLLYKIQRV